MGIDRAVLYTLMGKTWSLLSGVVTLLFVAKYLTPGEQGYYYTFASLIALQILFELGMSVVVVQFASHEMAHLSWTEMGVLEGDLIAKSRLRSLTTLVLKWYGTISILIVLLILPIGWVFLAVDQQTTISWQLSWVLLVITTAINIFFIPFLSLLEGCGRVIEVARLRVYQSVIGSLSAWVLLIFGGGLLALPAMNFGFAITVFFWLWQTKKIFFINLFSKTLSFATVKWKAEIWPFQWRIAISWLSGYFIFQLFTPILFAYQGAVEAGQMGMSISIANALLGIAIAWMNTKSPGFGSLIAKKDYVNLDRVFAVTLSRSLAIMVFVGTALCIVNYYIHMEKMQFSYRILDPLAFLLLMVGTVFAYVTYAQAAYLRAHKEEPFMLISIISAVFISVLAVLLGPKYGAVGLMAIYVSVYAVIGIGWGSKIFFSKRREWQHNSSIEE